MKLILWVVGLSTLGLSPLAAQTEPTLKRISPYEYRLGTDRPPAAGAAPTAPQPVPAPRDYRRVENPVTAKHGILCLSPFSLNEASLAVQAMDQKWLKSLNCITTKEGMPVIVIERNSLGWQVRLTNADGEGVTLWGWSYAFRSPTGQRLDDYGAAY